MKQTVQVNIIREEYSCDICNEKICNVDQLYTTGFREGYHCDVCDKDYCTDCFYNKEIIIGSKKIHVCENCEDKKEDKLSQKINQYLKLKESLDTIGKEIIDVITFIKCDLSGKTRKK